MLSAVAVAGGSGSSTPPTPTATIGGSASIDASLTAQLGPTALSLSAASVTTGATLAWTVYGPLDTDETAQIITAGSTSATPTWAAFTAASGRIDGLWVVKCVVTKDGLSTTYTRRVRVGDADGRYRTHFVNWKDAANAGALMSTTPTKDGIAIAFGYAGGDGSSTWTATEDIGLVGTILGGSSSIGLDWSGVDLGSETLDATDDVVWYFAFSAFASTPTATLANINFLDASGANRVMAAISYSGGYRVQATQRRASTYTDKIKAVASMPGMLALRVEAGVIAEVRYSLDDFDVEGEFPEFSAMTPVYTTRESNTFACMDLTATDTADAPAKSGSIGRMSVNVGTTVRAQEIRRRRV